MGRDNTCTLEYSEIPDMESCTESASMFSGQIVSKLKLSGMYFERSSRLQYKTPFSSEEDTCVEIVGMVVVVYVRGGSELLALGGVALTASWSKPAVVCIEPSVFSFLINSSPMRSTVLECGRE